MKNVAPIRQRLIVIGNGMAGIRTVEELLKVAPNKYEISVFGQEGYGNYNRILLSPVLAGEKSVDDIILNPEEWYSSRGITLHKANAVTRINRATKEVTTRKGTTHPYDKLLLATGSNPINLPIAGSDLQNVMPFRSIRDVKQMLALSQYKTHAVVIGAGLLGLEAANGLLKQGMDVTVLHLADHILNRQLDKTAAQILERKLSSRGVKFLFGETTERIAGDETGCVTHLHLSNGVALKADLVVMAVGVRPNTELAKESGIQCNKGILVDSTLQTYDPSIYAVGECVEHRSEVFGLVAPLYEHARVCANHLAHFGVSTYKSAATATQLKITGINVFSAGDFEDGEDRDIMVYHDHAEENYKKLVIKDHKLIGAVLFGDTREGAWYFELIQNRKDTRPLRDLLIFGRSFCDSPEYNVPTAAS